MCIFMITIIIMYLLLLYVIVLYDIQYIHVYTHKYSLALQLTLCLSLKAQILFIHLPSTSWVSNSCWLHSHSMYRAPYLVKLAYN